VLVLATFPYPTAGQATAEVLSLRRM
jgi:hypothetical protein